MTEHKKNRDCHILNFVKILETMKLQGLQSLSLDAHTFGIYARLSKTGEIMSNSYFLLIQHRYRPFFGN